MITLTSAENDSFSLPLIAIKQSRLLSNIILDLGESAQSIPLQNIRSRVLEKVVQYLNYHKDDPVDDGDEDPTLETCEWDQNFIDIDQVSLFDLILAANFLDIKSLLNLGIRKVADMINGKSVEELRSTFNIKTDLSKREQEAIAKEFEWCRKS